MTTPKEVEEYRKYKMYICVKEEVPKHMVPVLVAHSVLNHQFAYQDNKLVNSRKHLQWLLHSYKKCVVSVNQKEFDKISKLTDCVLSHENSTLEGIKSCATIVTDLEIPNVLKFAKLWK